MVTKWYQLEFVSGHANESETNKQTNKTKQKKKKKKKEKMFFLRSDNVFINFGLISPIFRQILKCSMVTKWYQLESMSEHANESEMAKRWLFTICLCFYQFWVNFTHFQ